MKQNQHLAGKSILIVDDEELLREILVEEFSMLGATVVAADCGNRAIELIRAGRFDFVISDHKMPEGDGIQLFAAIQKEIARKPILFLCTGFADVTPEQIAELGIKEIFKKPFSIDHITDVVCRS